MKLATFQQIGREAIGAVIDDGQLLVDLAKARHLLGGSPSPWFVDMLALIDADDEGLELAAETLADAPEAAILNVKDITLAGAAAGSTPDAGFHRLRRTPAKHIQAGVEDVRADAAVPDVWYERPALLQANRFSVVGSGTDIRCPPTQIFWITSWSSPA